MGGESMEEINEVDLILMKGSLSIVTDKRRRGWHFSRNLINNFGHRRVERGFAQADGI
jgi:hypothetical protein